MLGVLLFLVQVATAPPVSKDVLALVDQARALPPDYSADAMLRIADSALVKDTAYRRKLIEEAFLDGAHAQSSLLLQTRAIEAMLGIDPPRALALFRNIPPPNPPVLTCQDVAIPDYSPYYRTAAALFERAFTAEQRKADDDVQFLGDLIRRIQSPLQVVPAMKMMPDAGARMTAAQRQELSGAMAGVLDRVDGGDRAFSASESVLVPSALPEMHDTQMFVPALRSYIVRHLSGARCSDNIHGTDLPESAKQFNTLIGRLAQTTAQLRPIAAGEVRP
jgi:hypothetical protein